jgi:orotate phosphoribosyltransferase
MTSDDVLKEFRAAGGDVVRAACLVDRSGGRADREPPSVALATPDVPVWPADAPPELAAIPTQDPGSRRLHA